MNAESQIKLFAMSHQMVERELDRVEKNKRINLNRSSDAIDDRDDTFYPQFDEIVRQEAASMAAHYEVFYCLEKSIRSIICGVLKEKHGLNWWDEKVPDSVKSEVTINMKREVDSAVTPRSSDEIDYTTFGQLGDIVRKNWNDFVDTFNSQKAFNKVMGSLNTLRGPIAHCSPLPPNEVVRLKMTVEDWFRLMS